MKTVNTTNVYQIINWDTKEVMDLALSFRSIADKYLTNKIIKAYPCYDIIEASELQARIDGASECSYIDFYLEPKSDETIFDVIGLPNPSNHYAICISPILS